MRDLSQVVRRTPWDTPVPLYTRTSLLPTLGTFLGQCFDVFWTFCRHSLFLWAVQRFARYRARVWKSRFCKVRKVAERKFPEFFKLLSRILPRISLRIFPEFFEEFLCFVSWEAETRKNSPKIPPFFNAKFPGKCEKNIHRIFLERTQSKILVPAPAGRSAVKQKGRENKEPPDICTVPSI